MRRGWTGAAAQVSQLDLSPVVERRACPIENMSDEGRLDGHCGRTFAVRFESGCRTPRAANHRACQTKRGWAALRENFRSSI